MPPEIAGSVPLKKVWVPEVILFAGFVRSRPPGPLEVYERLKVYVPPAGTAPFRNCVLKKSIPVMLTAPGNVLLAYTCWYVVVPKDAGQPKGIQLPLLGTAGNPTTTVVVIMPCAAPL